MSDALFDALDRLVPDREDTAADWQTVLADAARSDRVEARPARLGGLFRRRRWLAVAAAAAVAAVLAATPAFGLRDLILDLIGRTSVSFVRSEPAPASVKLQFLELAVGAPAGMNPHVLPNQARQITFRGAGGEKRVLWIAPTEAGGFCSFVVKGGGGCVSKATEQKAGPVTVYGNFIDRIGQHVRIVEVDGQVFSARVATLTLEFQDHTSMPLPFVYVSSPINAGFFIAGIPNRQQQLGDWPTEVVARDAHGTVIGTAVVRIPKYVVPPPLIRRAGTHPQPPLPSAASVEPSAPTQTATVNGVTVVAGANGAIRITLHHLPAAVARVLHRGVEINCFRLTHPFGLFTVLGQGVGGPLSDSIGFTITGVGRPLDGCEIDGYEGHSWPPAYHGHDPIELPFTPQGRTFFVNQAAANDLALFVRSARMQQIRKLPDPELIREMLAAYDKTLTASAIRYRLTPSGITFTETATTGKQFRVVVKHGRIASSNLEPYAKVF